MTTCRLLLAALTLSAAASTQANAADWHAGPEDSTLLFRAERAVPTKDDLQKFVGTFEDWSATIRYEAGRPEAATIEVRIALGSLDTRDPGLDQDILDEDWFAAAQWPEAVYKAQGFQPLGGDRFGADGTLLLRGLEQPVALEFSLTVEGETALADGFATVDRSQFSIGDSAGRGLATVQVRVEFNLRAASG